MYVHVQAYWFMFSSAFPTGAPPSLWGFEHRGTLMIGTYEHIVTSTSKATTRKSNLPPTTKSNQQTSLLSYSQGKRMIHSKWHLTPPIYPRQSVMLTEKREAQNKLLGEGEVS